jgi:hypothetical protein
MKWILLANATVLFACGMGSLLAAASKSAAVSLKPLGYLGVGWAIFGVARVAYHVGTGHSLRSVPALMAIVTIGCLGPNAAMLVSPKSVNRWVMLATSAGCLALCWFAWHAFRRYA